MSTEENKTNIRRVYVEALNKGNMAVIEELYSPDHVLHTSSENIHGPEGFKQFIMMYRSAFPDLQFTVEDLIAEEDKVVSHYTASGTHRGNFQGIAPNNKHVTTTGIAISRFEHGKVVESWLIFNALSMLQQLGVIPTIG